MGLVGPVVQEGPDLRPGCAGHFLSVSRLRYSVNSLYYYYIQSIGGFMKIEKKAAIRRRIRNIQADIKACRNSGNTLRMRMLYAQLTSATIKLVNMTH